MFLHATCVALGAGEKWQGVLLRGPSGAGKSDLALRLLEAGGRLVADDQTRLTEASGRLFATAPDTLAGMIEARGIGILTLPSTKVLVHAPVALLVDLVHPDKLDRLPEPVEERLLGVTLPRVDLAPFEASAVAKLRLALARFPAP